MTAGCIGVLLVAASAAGAKPDVLRPGHSAATENVGPQMEKMLQADWLRENQQFSARPAEVTQPPATASGEVTTEQDAAGGCDGVKSGRFGFHTASGEQDPWWQVDLGHTVKLDRVVVYNRTDCPPERTRRLRILAADEPGDDFRLVYQHAGEVFYGSREKKPLVVRFDGDDVVGRIVRLQIPGRCSFALEEVEVYGRDEPERNLALRKLADQKSVGRYSRRVTKDLPNAGPQPPVRTSEPFSLLHLRDVLQRAGELAARIQPGADPQRLDPLVKQLGLLEGRLAKIEKAKTDEVQRREFYVEARRLARAIAFCNPLLDFDSILFLKRHDPGGLFHMVHQYYGFGQKPGGGLFVLSNPFSSDPKVTDLLAESVVENGRLAGRRLEGGSFLSPELSFDGRTIFFAYTQCEGEKPEWSPRASYHIFRVGADGTGLVQLTDGPWNDFDPCFLPSGRIVFISERRGGYLRCGGSAPPWDSPTYTLHSMAPDGSDIVCLSFHETQEWHPSVDNNGMLLYTRWDYVDRDTNVAHHLWTCYPDGRDPRSYHGNYPRERESRPWMEMSGRAVPGSNKFVATAAAHHGHAYGSLVLVDYRVEDDGAMSQIERLTPEVPLPEAEGGKKAVRQNMAYGTPWPLSEDDYLCVYDAGAGNRGIYWIDRYGNRELLYRDPEISCTSPIPLRSRPNPPAIPAGTTQAAGSGASETAGSETIAVMNVYDSDFRWPDETEITALRIIQVLPKTTPPVDKPRIGIATETNARAVLGTVPVESDGSAYFEAPIGKLIYFQAIDRRGMAVQSMRSATYVHPGERLSCQGCHERKHTAPSLPETVPLALRRAPSPITPDVDGSNPFNFVRLVQPALDRHCVSCHEKEKALDLSGQVGGKHGWTRSYEGLAKNYGFWFTVANGTIGAGVHGGSRTIPGQFGARAAKLLEYLDERHCGVKLSQEDFHRFTLWLDSNSEFFGAYEDTEAQARGELVAPALD